MPFGRIQSFQEILGFGGESDSGLFANQERIKNAQFGFKQQYMTNYSKVGNRNGKPAYRTPSSFRYRKYVKILKIRSKLQRAQNAERFIKE